MNDIEYLKRKLRTTTDPIERRKIKRQIELVEDSILIYRVHRAPERRTRRVFT